VLAGLAAAALALATVACTGMIYASLKPIPRWANGWTVPVYLLLALMTGALLLNALLQLFDGAAVPVAGWLALAAIALAALIKWGYWRHIDAAPPMSTAETATGLGHLGKVRLLEPPHSGENYLLREMGFRLARKHAARLRRLTWWLGFALPFVLSLAALAPGLLPAWLIAAAATIAAASALVGVLIERWLFFAEAQHAVMLYYGAARV
jgi:DMSO reductase anchor subunit